MSALTSLAPNTFHLWLVRPETIHDAALLARYEALLTPEEQARKARFAFDRLRHDFLITRALVRTTLSRYATIPPEAWRFSANSYGRPELSGPPGFPALKFNLSHTQGLIACLVGTGTQLGVDVEWTGRRTNVLDLAESVFSPIEVSALHREPAGNQVNRFFEYWTLKEAYIKARGMGLALPLDQFSFGMDKHCIRIEFHEGIQDFPERWQFCLYRPTSEHMMATAVESSNSPVRVETFWTTPLLE